MSKYVELILRNKHEIKNNLNIDIDEYDDLILIEKTIKTLNFSLKDLAILDAVSDFDSFRGAAHFLGRSRSTVSKRFKILCNKIADTIGDYFTDENYATYLKEKYHFNDEEFNYLQKILGEHKI